MTESLEQEIQKLRSLFWSERDPEGRGFASLADAYRRAGDVKQALDLLADGLSRHPEFTPGHVVAARLYVEQGMVEEGEMAARRALDLDEENVHALTWLAQALQGKDKPEEAAQVRDRLLALDPDALATAGAEAASSEAAWSEAASSEAAPSNDLAIAHEPVEEPASAPTDGLIDISTFAPFGFEEPVGEAAPASDETPEESTGGAFDLAGITLSGTEPTEDAVEDAADEPAEEPVLDVAALAPDEPEPAQEPVLDVAALAPDEPEPAEEAVLDVAALAPDEPEPSLEPVLDVAALAPDEPADDFDVPTPDFEDEVVDLEALARSASGEDPPEGSKREEESEAPIYTRTLAELYVKQGFVDRALEVLRYLQRSAPADESLARRIAELEAGAAAEVVDTGARSVPRRVGLPGGPEAAAMAREAEEEVETLARDLAESGDGGHEVETPFAWTEQEVEEVDAHHPTIGEYFDDLLGWRSRGGS